jgi:hypothetical protein
MNWLVRFTARALESREREIALGDLVECGASGMPAFLELLGLVVRRQLLIWVNWRPWLALTGVVGVSGFCLSRMLSRLGIGIFEQVAAWRHYGVHYNPGVTSFRDDVIHLSCLAVAIFFWTAVNASLLRRLSGRADWLTGLLFYVVVFDASGVWALLSGAVISRGNPPWWSAIQWILPLSAPTLCMVIFLFAIPGICGALEKLPAMIPATVLCTLAAAVLGGIRAHDLQTFTNGALPAAHWSVILAPYVLVSWPVFARHRIFRLE